MEDAVELVLERHRIGALCAVVRPVGVAHLRVPCLEGVEDALVVNRVRKDRRDGPIIIRAEVGHNDLRHIALGPQCQQEGPRRVGAAHWRDRHVQQVVGIHIHRDVDVHPLPLFTSGLVVGRHFDPLFVHTHHPAAAHDAEECGDRQQLSAKLADPTVGRRR